MPLNRPDMDEDDDNWYLYFRLTKSVSGMPVKFKDALADAEDANQSRKIMTAYSACALDILIHAYRTPASRFVRALRDFELNPYDLVQLSTDRIGQLTSLPTNLADYLSAVGYKVENGLISDYSAPSPAASPLPKKAVPPHPFQ